MLVAVSGTKFSGVDVAIQVLIEDHGFEKLNHKDNESSILDYATKHYTRNMVIRCETMELLETMDKRPFFVHISIDASLRLRMNLLNSEIQNFDVEKFVDVVDRYDYDSCSIKLREQSHFKFKILDADVKTLHSRLSASIGDQLQMLQNADSKELKPPLRPDWDTYFMKLATLAASRSNCMKRRVGCVIVRDHRVIATGYNGTPRHLTNCFNGGCPRCNSGDSNSLHSCLCLHAEENALLEAGRDRVGPNGILYCDTCPCLTCSVKIVQTGITEVVYSQSYRMDEESFKVLKAGGVKVRQFSFVQEPRIINL